jgi:hypothetical protein
VSEIDLINQPPHYTSSKAQCRGCERRIEQIDITRHMGFNLGNAIKYIWRCEHKGNKRADLQKAVWYLNDELEKLGK